MGYQGRAVVIDPDVFAVSDVWDLLSRDMQGTSIMVRPRSGRKEKSGCMATSVMLLDCEQLQHWRVEQQFASMFTDELDYMDWICLKNESEDSIGLFENEWNDFDNLTPATTHAAHDQTQDSTLENRLAGGLQATGDVPRVSSFRLDYVRAPKIVW